MKPGDFSIEELADGDRRTLVLTGELDLAWAESVSEAITDLCTQGATELELDLQGLTFLDSSGLRAMLTAGRLCEQQGCRLWLIPGPPTIQRVFELAGVLDALPFRVSAAPPSEPVS